MPHPGAPRKTEQKPVPIWQGGCSFLRVWVEMVTQLQGPATAEATCPRGDPGDMTERALNRESLGWYLRSKLLCDLG